MFNYLSISFFSKLEYVRYLLIILEEEMFISSLIFVINMKAIVVFT